MELFFDVFESRKYRQCSCVVLQSSLLALCVKEISDMKGIFCPEDSEEDEFTLLTVCIAIIETFDHNQQYIDRLASR